MKLRGSVLYVLLITVGLILMTLVSSTLRNEDDNIFNQFVTIRGKVESVDRLTQKIFTPVGASLIFQRVDCRRCLVIAVTDENGEYKLRVGKGKYRLIARENLNWQETQDQLAADQPRYINATDLINDNIFNVKLVRSSSPQEIKSAPLPRPPS